jgi:hypothetical protein
MNHDCLFALSSVSIASNTDTVTPSTQASSQAGHERSKSLGQVGRGGQLPWVRSAVAVKSLGQVGRGLLGLCVNIVEPPKEPSNF